MRRSFNAMPGRGTPNHMERRLACLRGAPIGPSLAGPGFPMVGVTADRVADVRGTWAVARVRPRAEKSVVEDLAQAGFDYFLPLVRKILRRPGHGPETYYVPRPDLHRFVFAASPGAVAPGFAVPTDLFYFLAGHPHVSGMIAVPLAAQPEFVRQLGWVEADVAARPDWRPAVDPHAWRRARVTRGPFMGHEGYVDAVGKRGRVRVVLETTETAVELDAPVGDLEPI